MNYKYYNEDKALCEYEEAEEVTTLIQLFILICRVLWRKR